MKRVQLVSQALLLGGIVFLFASCGYNSGKETGNDSADSAQNLNRTKFDTSATAMNSADFLVALYVKSLYDSILSQRMTVGSPDRQIKKFAASMAHAHAALNQQIAQLAEKEQVNLPATISQEQQNQLSALSKEGSTESDGNYVRQLVTDHKDGLVLLRQAIQSNDPDIVNWANGQVNVIQSLLDQSTTAAAYLDSIPAGRPVR